MSDYEEIGALLGRPVQMGPAALAYTQAQNLDGLYMAAGKHLALHAVRIRKALSLPRRGSLVLRQLKTASPETWHEYWRLQNETFCCCALLDICYVRDFFKQASRWPELAPLLEKTLLMASAYASTVLEMDEGEVKLIEVTTFKHLAEFRTYSERTHTEQLAQIFVIPGVQKEKIDKATLILEGVIQASCLEPFFMMQEYDRLISAEPDIAGGKR